ncbi:peptidase [Croceicoccus estronivorus]|uniref:A24 family peptidase n=1 Tax=Croceicoccus estronivorus TaxID=1172626 RepID=UPI00082B6815|nr:prepilin peptidase [Croceicoccus estronivorus]OCC25237.1 peptidase [Croceicoccus estronivorus]
MQDGFFHDFLLLALAVLLLVAACTDIRRRQIDNWLNIAIVAGAPVFWWASGLDLWPGVAIQIGMATGVFLVLAVLFAIGAMGGGDVKLLAALALWLEPDWFLRMLLIMALVGGMLTIVMAGWHVIRRQRGKLAIPYGVAIAAAGISILGIQYLSDNPIRSSLLG